MKALSNINILRSKCVGSMRGELFIFSGVVFKSQNVSKIEIEPKGDILESL